MKEYVFSFGPSHRLKTGRWLGSKKVVVLARNKRCAVCKFTRLFSYPFQERPSQGIRWYNVRSIEEHSLKIMVKTNLFAYIDTDLWVRMEK